MCANRPITDEERAAALAPIPPAVPPEYETQSHGDTEGSPAHDACGYRVEHDEPSGHFAFSLETPYEGATIQAGMAPAGGTYRRWDGCVRVLNCRGQGWTVRSEFHDCGRHVAKRLLRSLALDMRKAYCRRGQKGRQRAIARAIARREAEEAARA